jgi:predicted DCC family thiol-disulfide oxidoreductase YuxK
MPQMTLIFDGDCGFCKGWVERIRRRDAVQAVEFLAYQSEERKKRYPNIRDEDFQKGGYLYFPDGTFYHGADAAPHILRALPSWKWLSYFFAIPGFQTVARLFYSLIARNRRHLSRRKSLCGVS